MPTSRLSVGQRLALGFTTLMALMVLMAAGVQWQLAQVARLNQDIAQAQGAAVLAVTWQGHTQTNLARALSVAKSGGQAELKAFLDPMMKETTARINELQKQIEGLALTDSQRQQLGQVAQTRKVYIDSRAAVLKRLGEGDPQAAADVDRQVVPAANAYLAAQASLVGSLQAQAQEAAQSGAQALDTSRRLLLAGSVLALALGIVMAWRLTRSIIGPMRRLMHGAEQIAEGHLDRPMAQDRHDEIGHLQGTLEKMRRQLQAMVSGIRRSTQSIGNASSEIAAGAQDLSARTEQTASNLQEAASSIEQLAGNVRQTADAARTANQMAATAAEAAQRGGQVVGEVVSNMSDITEASRKIADIISVIDGIAFQTNILALNAAVEAARAGEQGRGFAVVAGEVRTLAQRSAAAAREIKTLIHASVERVESGSRLVQSAGSTMGEIVGSVQRVTDIIAEISASSTEQSDGIAQVNTAVNHLDQMTQQNAALVEESAAAAESLKHQAEQLNHAVDRFSVGDDPPPAPLAAGASPPAAAPAIRQTALPPAPRPAPRPAARAPAATPSDHDWETF
ncbi:methyl-accepting chemotaxis protein [Ideonella livida]|uniref:HAMP domain-containing protein n=1 Tax=Ideonella livida TaxID=2707176 RepID=A0A7C9TIX2_9BURK|nr:methyl-accepting chemotaxis protein [Ideonella livida]NDY91540.1 HAMP domain-containing protein [Ideonella livida]